MGFRILFSKHRVWSVWVLRRTGQQKRKAELLRFLLSAVWFMKTQLGILGLSVNVLFIYFFNWEIVEQG